MQYSFEPATGIKRIEMAPGEITRISSDQHLPPNVLVRLCDNILVDLPLNKYESGYKWFQDYFSVNKQDSQINHHILNGDWGHFSPEIRGRRTQSEWAMKAIGNVIQEKDLVGTHLTITPGNHSPISSIPEDVRDQLINRGILVPSGHSVLTTATNHQFDIKHGHEDDGLTRHLLGGNNPYIQEGYRVAHKLIRKITHTSYFPYDTPVADIQATLFNALEQINAEKDLEPLSWAVRSHTHFAKISPPHRDPQEEPINILSKEYLENLILDNKFARTVLSLAARWIPKLSGIDREFLPHNHQVGFINTGQYDPLSQILSLVDIYDDGVKMNLARVNGGYTKNMLNQRTHPAIWTKNEVHFQDI